MVTIIVFDVVDDISSLFGVFEKRDDAINALLRAYPQLRYDEKFDEWNFGGWGHGFRVVDIPLNVFANYGNRDISSLISPSNS